MHDLLLVRVFVIFQRWHDGHGLLGICSGDGFGTVPECQWCESFWHSHRFSPFLPSIAITVYRNARHPSVLSRLMNILARWVSLIRAMRGNNGPILGSNSNMLAAAAPNEMTTGAHVLRQR
jgi:hypothetical protein